MARRVHPSKRKWLRRCPAPPPIPDGYVTGRDGSLVLAHLLRADCAAEMIAYDNKPRIVRDRLKDRQVHELRVDELFG